MARYSGFITDLMESDNSTLIAISLLIIAYLIVWPLWTLFFVFS